MSDERIESLKAAIGQIERQFGKGAVMRMGDEGPKEKIDVISKSSPNMKSWATSLAGFKNFNL